VGIELEGTDDLPFTDAQYDALTALTRQLQSAFTAITTQRICGHSDIAPGRKTDPDRRSIGRAIAQPWQAAMEKEE
jgi:AmpD protein